MGTAALACSGVRVNRMISGMIGAGLTPPPLDSLVPNPPPLGAVPEETDDGVVGLVDLAISFKVL